MVAATIGRRPADVRASTLLSLDYVSTFYFGSELLAVPDGDRDRIGNLHLAALPDVRYQEIANDLLNFRWSNTFGESDATTLG